MDIKNLYKKDKSEIVKIFDSKEFNDKYKYDGELGAIYSKDKTEFRVWSPVASSVELKLYEKKEKDDYRLIKSLDMIEEDNVWKVIVDGDLNRIYYRYVIKIGEEINEVVDIYSKAVGVNGKYSMVVDLEKTNPEGFLINKKPELLSPVDSIIYEMHIRDFTIDKNSGVKNKGKFLGLTEEGTKFNGLTTGLDHLKELGITHVHLLPIYDYKSIDEKIYDPNQYNWGYDPENYNALEGSYSTNPYDGEIRIREFKEAVLKLHNSGIRVIIDVVYNHTFDTLDSIFNKTVPMYYYRENSDGSFSNGSACGNETASNRYMFRKFMVDSVKYFAKEYGIDGFRFDLMGLHDIETMKEIRRELDNIDKSILMYGEGWTGGDTPLKEEERALKKNVFKYGNMQIAAFSDDIRDGVKGNVFTKNSRGFASGKSGLEETIKCGVVASTNHSEVNYGKVLYSDKAWANEPYQTITYNSAHDNYTLWDKLNISCSDESEEELIKINKLIAAITLTSSGIVFLHSGEEFLRTKVDYVGNLVENSYNSSDFINKIDWNRKEKYKDVFEYYRGLISLRKNFEEFRIGTSRELKEKIHFIDTGINNLVQFEICGGRKVIVVYNGNKESKIIDVEEGRYSIVLDSKKIYQLNEITTVGKYIEIEGRSAIILIKD